jgi:hypothetical protein
MPRFRYLHQMGIRLAGVPFGESGGAALQVDDKRGLGWGQPQASVGEAQKHYAGLDVSVKEASMNHVIQTIGCCWV